MNRTAAVLTARPFSEEDGRAVCTWRYPPPYDVYDLPPWETACARGYGVADAEKRAQFTAVCRGGALAGFFRLRPEDGGVTLGLGLAPEHCGQGLGGALLALCIGAAAARFPGKPLRLEVRAFNARAIRCYRAAGFCETGRFSRAGAAFVRMERES